MDTFGSRHNGRRCSKELHCTCRSSWVRYSKLSIVRSLLITSCSQPSEIATCVVFLASSDSAMVAGQTIHCNGYVIVPRMIRILLICY